MKDIELKTLLLLKQRIEAKWPRAEVGDKEGAAEHGGVFVELDFLHLLQHGVCDRPVVVHHECDWYEEEDEEPGAQPGFETQEYEYAAYNGNEARKRNEYGWHGYALLSGILYGGVFKMMQAGCDEHHAK